MPIRPTGSFCLVRTSKDSKQGGISFVLFDMASEGVSTKPILLISGSSPFCETFFDNVRRCQRPIASTRRIKGWDVAKYLLGHEREMISAGSGLASGHRRKSADRRARSPRSGWIGDGRLADPLLRAQHRDVRGAIAKAFGAQSERFIDELKAGKAHPAQPSMMKYFGTELNKASATS